MRTQRQILFSLAILGTLFISAGSQTQTGPTAATAPKRMVIHAGRMLDVTSGKILQNQNIYVEGEKITKVEAASGAKPGAGWTLIDLPNATVLPGLIDCHVHMTKNPIFGY